MNVKPFLIACVSLTLAGIVLAQEQPKPEDLIRIRQASWRVVGWHCAKLKGLVDAANYSKSDVLASATVLQAIASAGVTGYFVPGTDKGVGYKETAAKPEAVDPAHAAHFAELAANLKKEADQLVKVAATGSQADAKAQFGTLAKTCKSCHDDFRK